MKNCNAPENQTTRRILLIACATALAVAFTVSLPQPAHADHVTPPPVPDNIQVPAGNKAFLVGHAVGTQNYICLPSGSGFAFTLFTPQATLFNDDDKQIITHFFSPNPVRGWHDSRHVAALAGHEHRLGQAESTSSSDPAFVAPGAIAWLLLHGGWSPRRTHRWRHADGDHLHPAAEHLWRGRTVDGLCLVSRRRQEGVRALHGRLLLLQGRATTATSLEVTKSSGRARVSPPRAIRRAQPMAGPPRSR